MSSMSCIFYHNFKKSHETLKYMRPKKKGKKEDWHQCAKGEALGQPYLARLLIHETADPHTRILRKTRAELSPLSSSFDFPWGPGSPSLYTTIITTRRRPENSHSSDHKEPGPRKWGAPDGTPEQKEDAGDTEEVWVGMGFSHQWFHEGHEV